MNDIGFALRNELRAERDALIAAFLQDGHVEQLLQRLTRAVDRVLRRVADATGVSAHAALIAVGGYGRGELFPHSDVDILILTRGPLTPEQSEAIARLVGLLWDMGLQLGHSVRTLEECREEARNDVTVLTAMLESRLVAGPRSLFRGFEHGIIDVLDREAFFQAKVLEQQQRHTKYHESPYSLEPNVKESPGGLRDLQVLLWVSRAAGLGASWRDLARRGIMTPEECRILRTSERVIKDLRARLHIVTDRREDRLVFDVQTAVARVGRLPRQGIAPRQRSDDATLLPGGEGGHAAQHHRAAEHRPAPHAAQRRRGHAHRPDLRRRATNCSTSTPTTRSSPIQMRCCAPSCA